MKLLLAPQSHIRFRFLSSRRFYHLKCQLGRDCCSGECQTPSQTCVKSNKIQNNPNQITPSGATKPSGSQGQQQDNLCSRVNQQVSRNAWGLSIRDGFMASLSTSNSSRAIPNWTWQSSRMSKRLLHAFETFASGYKASCNCETSLSETFKPPHLSSINSVESASEKAKPLSQCLLPSCCVQNFASARSFGMRVESRRSELKRKFGYFVWFDFRTDLESALLIAFETVSSRPLREKLDFYWHHYRPPWLWSPASSHFMSFLWLSPQCSEGRGCCAFLQCERGACRDNAVVVEGTESMGNQTDTDLVNRFGEGDNATTAPANVKCVEQGGKVIFCTLYWFSLIFNIYDSAISLFYSAISPLSVVKAYDAMDSFISASFKCQ